uniref:Uncharacterized protein n=1 Tax=Anguilla anguilla TaxID=7936 RepID=A0A0E9WSE5_ANGAN
MGECLARLNPVSQTPRLLSTLFFKLFFKKLFLLLRNEKQKAQ